MARARRALDGVAYVLAGVIQCITIIGIPFGIQSFKLAGYALWPFGRVVVQRTDRDAALSCLGNAIWFVLSGLWLALGHLAHRPAAVPHDHRHPLRRRLVQARRPRPRALRQDGRQGRSATAAQRHHLPRRVTAALTGGPGAPRDDRAVDAAAATTTPSSATSRGDRLGVRWGLAGGIALASIDEVREVARYAVAAGFDSLWISHANAVDPIVALACVADDIAALAEVGTSVVPLYGRHPIGLAQLARTAQSALGGRFTLGIGAASRQAVEASMGLAWDRPLGLHPRLHRRPAAAARRRAGRRRRRRR